MVAVGDEVVVWHGGGGDREDDILPPPDGQHDLPEAAEKECLILAVQGDDVGLGQEHIH